MTGRELALGTNSSTLETAAALEADGAFRVLRRLEIVPSTGSGQRVTSSATRVVCVADVETTSLDRSCHIVELALRRLRIDAEGDVVEVGRLYAFLEDPGEPLDPKVSRLTGLTDTDLAGQSIDTDLAVNLFRSCDVAVFHNADFDFPRLLDRLPALAGMPVACSLHEINWRGRGMGGALNLSCLLCQTGRFSPAAHRAGADVDATIAILAHRDSTGQTAMAELLDTAARPTLRYAAFGAAFAGGPKESLKARGYRWDADARVWAREVSLDMREEEQDWLAEHVYAARWNPKTDGPHVELVDWTTRYG